LTKKIAISKLAELMYCEYKFYLKTVKNVKAQMTNKMRQGTVLHQRLEEKNRIQRRQIKQKQVAYFKKVANIKKTVKPQLQKKEIAKLEKPPEDNKFREVKVETDKIRGKIDEVVILDDVIKIIDDKTSGRAFDSDKMQVYAYCLAYENTHPEKLQDRVLEASIRNTKTGITAWSEMFTSVAKQKVLDVIERIEGIFNGTITPIATDNPNLCKRCDVKDWCDKQAQDYDVNDVLI
jgi:hypothetical protein